MRAYGSGCTAALIAIFLEDARARRELPSKVVIGMTHMHKLRSGVRDNPTLPSGLIKQRLPGSLGPRLYFKGRRNLRKLADLQR